MSLNNVADQEGENMSKWDC